MPFGPKPVPEHRWFESKSLAARLFIMIAGVTMNMLLAFVVLTGLAFSYGEPVVATRVVGAVRAPASAPALAALRAGRHDRRRERRARAELERDRRAHRRGAGGDAGAADAARARVRAGGHAGRADGEGGARERSTSSSRR